VSLELASSELLLSASDEEVPVDVSSEVSDDSPSDVVSSVEVLVLVEVLVVVDVAFVDDEPWLLVCVDVDALDVALLVLDEDVAVLVAVALELVVVDVGWEEPRPSVESTSGEFGDSEAQPANKAKAEVRGTRRFKVKAFTNLSVSCSTALHNSFCTRDEEVVARASDSNSHGEQSHRRSTCALSTCAQWYTLQQ
jgi:hypothetical protein